MILSASRRTDIPHYYADWLLRRLKAGEVIARNPMNPRQLSRIFLSPQEIDCIVFWTKDPRNLMERLDEVDRLGYRYYFQFTLTPYPPDIEPGLPDKAALMDAFVQLSRRIGRERVVWRYDPIIVNQAFPIEWHCQQFSLYCQRLAPHTGECVISFLDSYAKLRPLYRSGVFRPILPWEMEELAGRFVKIGQPYALPIKACCEGTELAALGVLPASCISRERAEKACGYPLTVSRDKHQRPGCSCVESIDIGCYDSCPAGCLYCYACPRGRVDALPLAHNPESPLLLGIPGPEDKISTRKVYSLAESIRLY